MKIEPVWAGRVALHDYSCPSCDIFLFVDADASLSDDAITERIDRQRQKIVESKKAARRDDALARRPGNIPRLDNQTRDWS